MILPRHHRSTILAHARSQAPAEACGVLAGREGRVHRVYVLRNVAATPLTRFLADPEQQLQAFEDMEHRGLEMLAVYHSHPSSPAYPSPTDLAMATYPEVAHVIVSLSGRRPAVRCYTIAGGAVREEPLTTC